MPDLQKVGFENNNMFTSGSGAVRLNTPKWGKTNRVWSAHVHVLN